MGRQLRQTSTTEFQGLTKNIFFSEAIYILFMETLINTLRQEFT